MSKAVYYPIVRPSSQRVLVLDLEQYRFTHLRSPCLATQIQCSPYLGASNDTDVFSLYDVNLAIFQAQRLKNRRSNTSADALDGVFFSYPEPGAALGLLLRKTLPRTPNLLARQKIWWVEEDLNLRPHAYQACALTT
jgi:hypothetical protein